MLGIFSQEESLQRGTALWFQFASLVTRASAESPVWSSTDLEMHFMTSLETILKGAKVKGIVILVNISNGTLNVCVTLFSDKN